MNYRDLLFKLFWTMLNAALAAAVVEVANLTVWWGAIALLALQAASSWVRQKVGATPPDAPAVGVSILPPKE